MRRAGLIVALVAVVLAASNVVKAQPAGFYATLTGAEQVPAQTTPAYGTASFLVEAGGNSLRYSLTVVGVTNVMMAHIHIGAPGQNGAVVLWLYPSAPPPRPIAGDMTGDLGSGVATRANLVGPLAGQPLSALISAMAAGNAYVNVHTQQAPGGLIRGQIR
jgi:hypothetical protein